jgi:lantibiotic leader peptide-processing serine protease
MHRQSSVFALVAVLALAGCSTDAVAPIKAPFAPSFAVGAGATSGSYIVLFNGKGIPADFADRVATLGGIVSYANGKAGFASVAGLSDASAVQIGAIGGVSDVQSDDVVALDTPIARAEADASNLINPSIDSQLHPETAILASWQWNMKLIGMDTVWKAQKLGNAGVTVAILDTGIDYDDLDVNGLVDLSRSTSFMSTFAKATDTSAVRPADDTVSKKFFPTRSVISDYNGHGSNVAQQVSSKAVAFGGVSSKTTLIGVKVLGSNGVGSFGQILSGVLWAADHGADVANMSLGGAFSKAGNGRLIGAINKVFNYAKQQGMLIVVSAGNSGSDLQHNGNVESSFCDSPHVICVSAVGPTTWKGNADAPAFYTNFGRSAVTIAAPGGNGVLAANGKDLVPSDGWPWALPPKFTDVASWVWSMCSKTIIGGWTAANVPQLTSCVSGGRVTGGIGTSQASPHVAGLAALLVAEMGHGQPQQIKQAIQNSADPINPLLGRGRISVRNAFGL